MYGDQKPLFSLTIADFTQLVKLLVNEALEEKQQQKTAEAINTVQSNEDHFNIKGLAAFLGCSKVSIHNYKKKGMPYYRVGRKILFKKQEVLNFMKGIKAKRVVMPE